MRGRKQKPIELKILQGNPGKRKIPLNIPKAGEPDSYNAPVCLDIEEKEKWDEMVAIIKPTGILTKADVDILVMYCKAWVGFKKWDEMAKKAPLHIYKDAKGKTTHSQRTGMVNMRNDYAAQVRSYGAELGLSPSARTKLRTEKTEEKSPLMEFLKQGHG